MKQEEFDKRIEQLRQKLISTFCGPNTEKYWEVYYPHAQRTGPRVRFRPIAEDDNRRKVFLEFVKANNITATQEQKYHAYNVDTTPTAYFFFNDDPQCRSFLLYADPSEYHIEYRLKYGDRKGQYTHPLVILLREGHELPSYTQAHSKKLRHRTTQSIKKPLIELIKEFVILSGGKGVSIGMPAMASKYSHLPPLAYAYRKRWAVFIIKTKMKSLSFEITRNPIGTFSATRINLDDALKLIKEIADDTYVTESDEENINNVQGESMAKEL